MNKRQDILNNLQLVETARDVSQTYEEIAAQRVLATRESVTQTRLFLDQVQVVYGTVQTAYLAFTAKQKRKHHVSSALEKNGRTALVLLSANRGMYGDLPYQLAQDFSRNYDKQRQKTQIDVFVIGKIGQYLLDFPLNGAAKIPYKAYDLADDKPTTAQMTKIITAISKYDTVFITYGKYESLLSLQSVTENIAGSIAPELPEVWKESIVSQPIVKQDTRRVLIEPSITKVAQFFETEILGALFRQKVYEMQLARFASRMIAMDGAIMKAQQRMARLKQAQRQVDRSIMNKKIQQLFAGSALWFNNEEGL